MPLHSLFNHDYMYRNHRFTINIHLRKMFQLEMEKIRIGLKIQTEISIYGRIQRNTAVPLVFTFLVLVFFPFFFFFFFFSGLLYYCILFYFILLILFYSIHLFIYPSLHFSFLFSSFSSSADHHLFFFFSYVVTPPSGFNQGHISLVLVFSLVSLLLSPLLLSSSRPPPPSPPSITFSPPRA